MNKLSVIIPCYNEEMTIFTLLQKVENVDIGEIEKEIIVINDGSTDGTMQNILAFGNSLKVLENCENKGKGYSVRKGLRYATGDYVVIQDADLEYNPKNIQDLINCTVEYDVVYGSRIHSEEMSSYWFYLGGIMVTKISNLLFGTSLTDQPTCYKLFRKDILEKLPLKENRFGFCSEVTALLACKGIKIAEIPIEYYPRKPNEGKKIKWKDGLNAIFVLFTLYIRIKLFFKPLNHMEN